MHSLSTIAFPTNFCSITFTCNIVLTRFLGQDHVPRHVTGKAIRTAVIGQSAWSFPWK